MWSGRSSKCDQCHFRALDVWNQHQVGSIVTTIPLPHALINSVSCGLFKVEAEVIAGASIHSVALVECGASTGALALQVVRAPQQCRVTIRTEDEDEEASFRDLFRDPTSAFHDLLAAPLDAAPPEDTAPYAAPEDTCLGPATNSALALAVCTLDTGLFCRL